MGRAEKRPTSLSFFSSGRHWRHPVLTAYGFSSRAGLVGLGSCAGAGKHPNVVEGEPRPVSRPRFCFGCLALCLERGSEAAPCAQSPFPKRAENECKYKEFSKTIQPRTPLWERWGDYNNSNTLLQYSVDCVPHSPGDFSHHSSQRLLFPVFAVFIGK